MRRSLTFTAAAALVTASFSLGETRPLATLEHRLKRLSGPDSTYCGTVKLHGDAGSPTNCVLDAFANGDPFYVIYDVQELRIDSYFIDAVAGDNLGNVYDVEYGSSGWGKTESAGSKLYDGRKILVEACPKPIVLKKSVYGGVTCLPRLTAPSKP